MIVNSGPPHLMLDSFREVGIHLYPKDRFFRDNVSHILNQEAMLFVVPARGRVAAFTSELLLDGKQVGIIGYYECEDNLETARALTDSAEAWLASRGAQILIGPMDGSTWHKYRFKTVGTASYFLDHYHKPWYPKQYVDLGFEPIAKYYSTILPLEIAPVAHEVDSIAIRQFRASSKEGDLRSIYNLSMEGFRDNFLFTPIAQREFLAMYEPIIPLVDPRLVVFAEVAGNPIAFAFAIPDQQDQTRIVVKSAAVLPEHRGQGIGSLMIRTIQETARELGYKNAIHAFMHEDNISQRFGTPDAQMIAEYVLYAKPIS